MERLSADVTKKATVLLRKSALAVLRFVVLGTPVGNKSLWLEPNKAPVAYVGGRARANWLVAINGPANGPVQAIDAGGGGTISAGESVINTARHYDAIHLTNNLPYIIPLNDGHSRQAPAGFIDTAVIAGMTAVVPNGLEV